MFLEERTSGFHDFKQKSGHRTNSWSKSGKSLPKKWPKIANVPIYNQIILKLFNWSICIFTKLFLLQIFIILKLFVEIFYTCLHGKAVWRSKGFQNVLQISFCVRYGWLYNSFFQTKHNSINKFG